ncbi:hypothetical protein V4Y02_23555, partial [Escherichia coli]
MTTYIYIVMFLRPSAPHYQQQQQNAFNRCLLESCMELRVLQGANNKSLNTKILQNFIKWQV